MCGDLQHPPLTCPFSFMHPLLCSSAIKNGCATVLLENCWYHFRHQSKGTMRERKSTCSLSPGGEKAASKAQLSGKAISSRCQLTLKNNFYFSSMLHLPPKCFQCQIAGVSVFNSCIFVDFTLWHSFDELF